MTIASEITRLQGAKADIKTAIEGKGVSVPSSTKLDGYDTYIEQIQTGVPEEDYKKTLAFNPATFISLNIFQNTNHAPLIEAHLGDIFNRDIDAYYRFFWLMDKGSASYYEYRLCVWVKKPMANPTLLKSDRIANDRFYFRTPDWRMKRDGNNIKFSALWYEGTSSYSSSKDVYYCENYDSSTNTFTKHSCGIMDDIGRDAVYANRTSNCGITAAESVSAINKTTMSIQSTGMADTYHLIATLNN